MKQLRYLQDVALYHNTPTKQANGATTYTANLVLKCQVQLRELSLETIMSIYGGNVRKVYRISSPRYELETYLNNIYNPSANNVSEYFIVLNNNKFKITSANSKWVDIEMIEL